MRFLADPLPNTDPASRAASRRRPRLGRFLGPCLATALALQSVPLPSQKALAAPAAGEARWPTYHNDAALQGYSSTSLPAAPVRLWQFNAGAPVDSTPIAGPRLIYVATEKGDVIALDDFGTPVWSRTLHAPTITNRPPQTETFDAPLLYAANTVFAGSRGGRLHALDAETGKPRWTHSLKGSIRGTAAFRDSTNAPALLVIDQADGAIHSLDARTGAPRWKSEPVGRTDGSFSLAGDRLVFGNCNSALYAFSAADGTTLASVPLGDNAQVAGGVALAGAIAFAGNRNGVVTCIDMATSEIIWTNRVSNDEVFTTPALGPDLVIVGADDGTVHALDRKTGVTRWSFTTRGQPTSPVIASDKVLVTADGVLHLLKLADGSELGSIAVSDRISSPAVIGNRIVVSGSDGHVTAFGPPPGPAKP